MLLASAGNLKRREVKGKACAYRDGFLLGCAESESISLLSLPLYARPVRGSLFRACRSCIEGVNLGRRGLLELGVEEADLRDEEGVPAWEDMVTIEDCV